MSQVTVATDNPAGKKLAKLQKKLQQIQELKERHANGERLEENQVNKCLTSVLGIPVHACTLNHQLYVNSSKTNNFILYWECTCNDSQ